MPGYCAPPCYSAGRLDQQGKRAGFIQNAEMVDAGASICLAFIRDHSRGATLCATPAEAAGIPTTWHHAQLIETTACR